MVEVNRDTIIDALIPHFARDQRYWLIVCDSGFGKMDTLKKLFPDRVYNFGIMEQATVGIAAGMAEVGFVPIVYSIAAFLVLRALEQIKLDAVIRGANVKFIGNGADDYFKFLDEIHCIRNDGEILRAIGLPFYHGWGFDDWIKSEKAGYIKC